MNHDPPLKPNKHLSLKFRAILGPWDHEREAMRQAGGSEEQLSGWVKRGAAEELQRTLEAAQSRQKHLKDTVPQGLAEYRRAVANGMSKIAALRHADYEVGLGVAANMPEGAERDAALLKWLPRAEYWEQHHKSDARWLIGLGRLLGRSRRKTPPSP